MHSVSLLLLGWALVGLITFIALLFMPAPYGRHTGKKWGKGYSSRISFFIMEFPAFIVYLLAYLFSGHKTVVSTVFFLLFEAHYIRRTFVYPFTIKPSATYPVLISLMAVIFNLCNGSFITYYLCGEYVEKYSPTWLASPQFLFGVVLFILGYYGNVKADRDLANLRKPGETGYKIPHGGLFEYISCPNYACEIVEWLGFCLLTSNIAVWVFLLWTLANLAPRAISHHKWYKATFKNYPPHRRALIPFIL